MVAAARRHLAALDLAAVSRLAAQLRELGVFWLEEPLPQGHLDGMRMLREQAGIRVAGGEMARTPGELLDALEAGALDVVQPDVVLAVGMLRARTVAECALLRHHWFTPHTWTNGLGLLANLHVVAGVGGGPFVEFPYDPPGWTPQRRDFFLASRSPSVPTAAPRRPTAPWPGRRHRRGRRNALGPGLTGQGCLAGSEALLRAGAWHPGDAVAPADRLTRAGRGHPPAIVRQGPGHDVTIRGGDHAAARS